MSQTLSQTQNETPNSCMAEVSYDFVELSFEHASVLNDLDDDIPIEFKSPISKQSTRDRDQISDVNNGECSRIRGNVRTYFGFIIELISKPCDLNYLFFFSFFLVFRNQC